MQASDAFSHLPSSKDVKRAAAGSHSFTTNCKRILPRWLLTFVLEVVGLGCWLAGFAAAQTPDSLKYPGAAHVPASKPGWERFLTKPDPNAPEDEAQSGHTALGTPVAKRVEECFPAEPRNLFWEVDQVASGPGGKLEPLQYHADPTGSKVDDPGRNAIRGQNTWMLWGEGNEAFWGWLQERGYGLVDFLILLDSRKREHRFHEDGLINQPGMKSQTDPAKRILGLYLDEADGEAIRLKPPDEKLDAKGEPLIRPPEPPPGHRRLALFEPGDPKGYEEVVQALPKDGVDYNVYGYPSGVVGLRLFPNPDFFGSTPAAERARGYWEQRVTKSNRPDAYYTDPNVYSDPKLVRPFRPSMSCAFCHIGPHPLNPPQDPEKPEWKNLSSIIGNQYWRPTKAFANLTQEDNFLYHFIASQQPGTIDTSLVSTDHINNANTINAIFQVPARLERARKNPPEQQSTTNLLEPGAEDGFPLTDPRHTPRVLLDGADSIGVFGALCRVYLNIGTFYEEWSRCHNPIIGFKPQKPFGIATCRANSVYWRTSERYRIPYLTAFFTLRNDRAGDPPAVENATTAPMHLANVNDDAPGVKEIKATLDQEKAAAAQGRTVFLNNCAICHSSKQPDGFQLEFSRRWASAAPPQAGQPARFTLPMGFAEWEAFKRSPAYEEYVRRISALAGQPALGKDAFLEDNFLSTDIRVPVTLVGTNSGRAMATNGMRGQVWDNFSSEDYKNLPAVGPVRFYNPYSGVQPDSLGFNDVYYPPGGGVGYYRPASLVSLWATAPYLHNNALGLYNQKPSVEGRLAAFDDGIRKLLWNSRRVPDANHAPGDLRWGQPELTSGDPGFIYRTPQVTWINIPGPFIRELIEGLTGPFWTPFLTLYLWLLVAVLLALLAWWGRPRHVALVLTLVALITAAGIVVSRLDRVYWVVWLVPAVALAFAFWLWFGTPSRLAGRIVLGVLILLSLGIGYAADRFVNGGFGDLKFGPIPEGTPVNLLMNINPEAPPEVTLNAGTALVRGILLVRKHHLKGKPALHAFEKEAGLPLLKASKCPDFVLDRGHWFGEALSDDEKNQLIAFLKTL